MSDDLIVSGGGRYVVASDEMIAQSERLSGLSGELEGAARSLTTLIAQASPTWLRSVDAPLSAVTAEQTMVRALADLQLVRLEADVIGRTLRVAMESYGYSEAMTTSITRGLSDRIGYALGWISPFLAAVALPGLVAVAGGVLLGAFAAGGGIDGAKRDLGRAGNVLGAWAVENNEMLTDPDVVALVRGIAGGSDDFLGGLFKLPPALVSLLGDDGLRVTGLSTSAAIAALIGSRFGLFGETPVAADRTSSTALAAAPRSLADRVARVPRPSEMPKGEQIRIDRYEQPDGPDRFDVYIAGTVDFALAATTNPFDMTSNVNGIGELPAGSYRALRAAMADAGVTSETPIQLTGYSQGGLLASLAAASGDYDVRGVFTLGAPAGQVEIPSDVRVLAVRHAEDIVPATGGHDVNNQALVVERAVFAGQEVPAGVAIPAHQLGYYAETAVLIDAAGSSDLNGAARALTAFGAGATAVESSTYVARRIPDEAGGRGG